MQIGQSITTNINGTPITAQITNISANITGLPAGEEQPPIAWKIDDYTAAVANGQITELPAVETPEV